MSVQGRPSFLPVSHSRVAVGAPGGCWGNRRVVRVDTELRTGGHRGHMEVRCSSDGSPFLPEPFIFKLFTSNVPHVEPEAQRMPSPGPDVAVLFGLGPCPRGF